MEEIDYKCQKKQNKSACSDLHIVALLVGSFLRHQDVVLLGSVPLPVRDLLAVCLHLLKNVTGYMSRLTPGGENKS